MPPSKLTKAQQGQLSKRQAGKVERATSKVEQAKSDVAASAGRRNNQRLVVGALREELGGLEQKLDAHPLLQKIRDKTGDIEVARADLQAMADDLEDARGRLAKALARHGEVISSAKRELEPSDGDADDSDDGD